MSKDMTPADVLRGALEVLRRDGWMQGIGTSVGPCCVLQAISRSWRELGMSNTDGWRAEDSAVVYVTRAIKQYRVGYWNDTRSDFSHIEDGLLRAIALAEADDGE